MVTLKDIAENIGISTSAVSRILNYDPTLQVPESTKAKVFETANAMGYKKKKIKRKTAMEGFKVAIVHWYTMDKELSDPFYLSMRIGAENFLTKMNVQIIRIFRDEINLLNKISDVDGMICIGKFSKKEITDFRKISDKIVFLDMLLPKIYVSSVNMDVENALKDVIEYLKTLGHTTIGFLGGIEKTSDNEKYPDQRIKFFKKYCDMYQINYANYIYEDEFTIQSGYKMMERLVSENEVLPGAIFCANDLIAQGAMRAAVKNRIVIPKDLSIVGFNNDKGTDFTNPPLTTISVPSSKIGTIGAQLLSIYLSSKKIFPIKITVPCELIIRESCSIAKK